MSDSANKRGQTNYSPLREKTTGLRRAGFVLSVGSHQNGTFALAKQLRQLNFDVFYAGSEIGLYHENLRSNAELQGFVYHELEPCNAASVIERGITSDRSKAEIISLAENLISGTVFRDFIGKTNPELLFIDVHLPLYAIVFSGLGIPVVMISTELFTGANEFNPPVVSGVELDKHTDLRAVVSAEWGWLMDKMKLHPFTSDIIDELSTQYKYPWNEKVSNRCLVLFGFDFPELVVWPAEFEFTEPRIPHVFYAGSYVDKTRVVPEFPSISVSPDRPTVLFSTGTVPQDARLLDVIRKFMEAFRQLGEVDFIVVAGRLHDQLNTDAGNIRIVKQANQLELLQKVRAMITLGGGNTIKECLEYNVPMLCSPYHNDQFGNASRVQFHGLGLICRPLQETPGDISAKILKLIHAPGFRENIQKFNIRASKGWTDDELMRFVTEHVASKA